MQTYTIEAAKADFVALLHRAAQGEEVLITENEQPIAKLVAAHLITADEDERYKRDVRALRGFLKGMDTTIDREQEDRV